MSNKSKLPFRQKVSIWRPQEQTAEVPATVIRPCPNQPNCLKTRDLPHATCKNFELCPHSLFFLQLSQDPIIFLNNIDCLLVTANDVHYCSTNWMFYT
jgi:uncharacterized protein (DUF1499 family)